MSSAYLAPTAPSSSGRAYQIALFVLQKFACVPSALGSLMIISQVCRSEFNRKKPQQRLMLGISVIDLNTSIFWIFTNFFMPRESGMLFAMGNQSTCDAQGFAVQFSTAGILYMCALQLQYLLVIKYGWRERRIQRIERWMHSVPIAFGIGTASAALALGQYNPANWDCWIGPLPEDCTSSLKVSRGGTDLTKTDCVRGNNAEIYRWAFFYGPLWVSILFCIVVMLLVYRSVLETERKSREWSIKPSTWSLGTVSKGISEGKKTGIDECAECGKEKTSEVGDGANNIEDCPQDQMNALRQMNAFRRKRETQKQELKLTMNVKMQSFMYAGAYFAVWTFPTLARLIQLFGGKIHPSLTVLAGTFIGSQGFFNALIYFRPRYIKCIKYGKWYQKVWALISSTLFFCCYSDDYTKDKKDYVATNEPQDDNNLGIGDEERQGEGDENKTALAMPKKRRASDRFEDG